jgi:hypothetical protein
MATVVAFHAHADDVVLLSVFRVVCGTEWFIGELLS